MSSRFDALEEEADKAQADADVLHENKVRDIVEISRGNVIANEQNVVLGTLGLLTGYTYSHDRNVNSILTGPAAVGKSDAQDAIQKCLPSSPAYEATDASSSGVRDDNEWETALYAPLDEWQKVPDELTEILKSLAGGPDDEYRYVRSVSDDDADSGRSGYTIIKKPKPYQFLYAQHGLEHELSTRLVFLPADDSVHIRDAIIEKQGGAAEIDVEGYENEYIFGTREREQALRQHFRELPSRRITMSNGDINHRGGVDGYLPAWIRKSAKTIFDRGRVETNRVSGQVFNLIRASAVANYDTRAEITVEYGDKEIPAYVAEPQDAVNVLACREKLLAKTHHLTEIKREIIDAIRAHQFSSSSEDDGVGVKLETIESYLKERSALSVPRKEKLRSLLDELDEHYYIDIHERAASDGTSHLYEFKSLASLDVPRIGSLRQYMDAEEIAECEDLCSHVDLDDPYAGVTDPFRDQPFKESVEAMREELAQNPAERADDAAELAVEVSEDDDASSMSAAAAMGGSGSTESGQATLGTASSDGDVEPEGALETAVYERLREHAHDSLFPDHVEDAHLIGVVDTEESVAEADTSGTVLDSNHELWDQPTKPDDWVTSEGEAAALIEESVTALERKDLVEYQVDDQTGYVGVTVADV